jgi:hypothetical protein
LGDPLNSGIRHPHRAMHARAIAYPIVGTAVPAEHFSPRHTGERE